MVYELWMEGYYCTGMETGPAPARMVGRVEASSFKNACIEFSKTKEAQKLGGFREENLSFYDCRLFDNPVDARRLFG